MGRKKINTEEFIKRATEIHGDKYNYNFVNYVGSLNKVDIICKTHGLFNQEASSHLRGVGCQKCYYVNQIFTSKLFIEKANKVHNNKYDYSLVNYINSTTKIIIRCSIHGNFEQIPSKHLSKKGCPKCGFNLRIKLNTTTTKQFIDKSKLIHNNKYDYKLTIYKNVYSKVKIKCYKHGIFEQIPNTHLNGSGCIKCKNELTSKRNIENPTGWSYKNWEIAGLKSRSFDSFKVYIIECWNENERFYKIGKTFTTISKRFNGNKSLPYNYNIIKLFNGDARKISELENKLKINNKKYLYTPKIKFNGMYECFIELENNEEFFII